MKANFESYLHDIGDELEKGLDGDADNLVFEYALKHDIALESQEEVLRLQEQKQDIMDWLKHMLAVVRGGPIDQGFCPSSEIREKERSSRLVSYYPDEVSGEDVLTIKRSGTGKEFKITEGQIMAGVLWNKLYTFSEGVPPVIQKRYYISVARHWIGKLLDKQIIANELARIHERLLVATSDDERNDCLGVINAYEERSSELEEGQSERTGLFVERMVRSFLTRLIVDYNLPIDIMQSDIEDDVRGKIDLIIRVHKHNRGVDIADQPEHMYQAAGLQFSTRTDDRTTAAKQKMINVVLHKAEQGRMSLPVDDIVLVQFDVPAIRTLRQTWNNREGVRPGGPEELLPLSVQEDLFKALLQDIKALSASDIGEMWQTVVAPRGITNATEPDLAETA